MPLRLVAVVVAERLQQLAVAVEAAVALLGVGLLQHQVVLLVLVVHQRHRVVTHDMETLLQAVAVEVEMALQQTARMEFLVLVAVVLVLVLVGEAMAEQIIGEYLVAQITVTRAAAAEVVLALLVQTVALVVQEFQVVAVVQLTTLSLAV
jgi:hypothetical protein